MLFLYQIFYFKQNILKVIFVELIKKFWIALIYQNFV